MSPQAESLGAIIAASWSELSAFQMSLHGPPAWPTLLQTVDLVLPFQELCKNEFCAQTAQLTSQDLY